MTINTIQRRSSNHLTPNSPGFKDKAAGFFKKIASSIKEFATPSAPPRRQRRDEPQRPVVGIKINGQEIPFEGKSYQELLKIRALIQKELLAVNCYEFPRRPSHEHLKSALKACEEAILGKI